MLVVLHMSVYMENFRARIVPCAGDLPHNSHSMVCGDGTIITCPGLLGREAKICQKCIDDGFTRFFAVKFEQHITPIYIGTTIECLRHDQPNGYYYRQFGTCVG